MTKKIVDDPQVNKAWRVTMEWMRGQHLIVNQIGTVAVDIDGTLTLQNWALSGMKSNWFETLTKRWVKERSKT